MRIIKEIKINIVKYVQLPIVLFVIMVTFVACEKEYSAKSTGESIDTAMEKTGESVMDSSEKVEVFINDAAITANIKALILSESVFKLFDINVDTVDGVTTLEGNVDTVIKKEELQVLAEGVEGVKSVNNNLKVVIVE